MSTIQIFNFAVNILIALLWQYNTATALQTLLTSKQEWYTTNQTDFWNSWYTDVFDLLTCNDFGCIVWAIILGLPTAAFDYPALSTFPPWGFDAFNLTNFDGQSNFAASAQPQIPYTTAQKRMILQLRYRQMTSRGTIPELNKILADIVVPIYGAAYMTDGLNMTMTLVCPSGIDPTLSRILNQFDVLPRPAGVSFNL